MFSDQKPDHPLQIGSIDPDTDVRAVLEGTILLYLDLINNLANIKSC
jgi:hypothetical protein